MMEIVEITHGDVVVLQPVGAIDTRSAMEFERKVVDLFGRGTRRFAIDFARVDTMTSAGLRVLVMLVKKLASVDGGLVLCALNDHVKTVFEISGLTEYFSIVASRTEAVERLAGGGRSSRISALAAKLLGGGSTTTTTTTRRRGGSRKASELSERLARILGGEAPSSTPPRPPKKKS